MNYSIIIVGEHRLWTSLMGNFLAQHGFCIAGIYTSTSETLIQIRKAPPDVVVIDNRRSTHRGARQILSIKNEFPRQKVILLSASQEPRDLVYVLKCNANGYLLKDTTSEQVLEDIVAVCRGETRVSPDLMNVLLEYAKNEEVIHKRDIDSLTMREREVMELVARGMTNKEIANFLSISLNTVKNHVKSILSKLSLHSRSQAIARWNHISDRGSGAAT